MPIRDCIPEIREITGGRLNDDQINQILEEMQRRRDERLKQGRAERDEDVLMQDAQELAKQVELNAKIEKRNRALNVLARKRVNEFVDNAIDQGVDVHDAIQALNVGINRQITGGRLSVDAKGVGLFGDYLGGMVAELRRAGLLEHITRRGGLLGDGKGSLDLDIAREMRAVSAGEGPATRSGEARQVAEIIHRHQERARQRLNRAGGWVGKRWDYIVRQSHDQKRVSDAGFEEWRAFVEPLLDEKTFNGAERTKFLRAAWEGISTGIHLRADMHGTNPPEGAFKGPANLAKKVSAERVLHFKDADSWFQYNERFGTKSLIEAVVSGFETSARATALMETWGTNPRNMFNDVRRKLQERFRDRPELIRRLGSGLDKQFNEIDGTTRQVENISAAHISSAIRSVQSMAKLGGAVISSITDVATAASELRWQGRDFGDAYAQAFANIFDGLSSKEAREVADILGVGLDGITGSVMARFSATDNIPGRMSKVQQLFFKMNLLSYWTDGHKSGMGKLMAYDFAKRVAVPFQDLHPRMRRLLDAYGITADDWGVLGRVQQRMADGRSYLTPDMIRDLDDEALAPLVGERMKSIREDVAKRRSTIETRIRELRRDQRRAGSAERADRLGEEIDAERRKLQTLPAEEARRLKSTRERALDRLETSLRALYSDRVNSGVPTPGARERAIMHQGEMRGTLKGEAFRFMMQFKAFPITFHTKVLSRELGGYGPRQALLQGKGEALGFTALIAGTTILGMGAMQMKEILKGRSPRDPFGENWRSTWTAAFLQGGGAGIFGDFLFGEYNRFGRSLTDTLAGPTIGTVGDLAELFARFRAGDDFGGKLVRVLQSNTPFVNLFYTKLAMDYLIVYHLQEALNPGYLRRMERRIERENDQTFLLRPSEAVQ